MSNTNNRQDSAIPVSINFSVPPSVSGNAKVPFVPAAPGQESPASLNTVNTAGLAYEVNTDKENKGAQDAWTLDTVYKILPEFTQKYVQDIKGKRFVKYPGLLILCKIKGMKSLTVKVAQFPSADNGGTAICEAVLIGWDKSPDKQLIEVTYTEIGDANTANCTAMVSAHYIRIAATRAKGRAMRDYLGIDAVMDEEMIDMDSYPGANSTVYEVDASAPAVTPDMPVTQDQINEINSIITQLNWTHETLNRFIAYVFSENKAPGTLSYGDAQVLTAKLKEQQSAAAQPGQG